MNWTPEEYERQFDELMKEYMEIVDSYIIATVEMDRCDSQEKPLLAKLYNQSPEKTSAAKEKYSYDHQEYRDYLNNRSEVVERAHRARLDLKEIEIRLENLRSVWSFKKTIIERGG